MADQKNLGGRPSFYDKDQIAHELIEWAQLPDSINLCGFCCTRNPPLNPRRLSEWSKEETEQGKRFKEAYETAKAFLGWRREKKLNDDELHVKAYDLNAAVYDYFLKEENRQQAEYESDLRKKEDANKQDIALNLIDYSKSKQ